MSAVRKLQESVSRTAHDVASEISAALGERSSEYGTRAAKAKRPNLKVVPVLRTSTVSRPVFFSVIAGLLVTGMVVMLLVNTQLAQGAFTISALQQQKAALDEQAATLTEEVAAAAAPDALEQAARQLGMVPTDRPVFIRVPDGTVLGKPKAAVAQPIPAGPVVGGTPADATAVEGVDSGAADFPAALPADYDPAAADAASAGITPKGTGKAGKKAGAAAGAAGAASEDSLWTEIPVDLGPVGGTDADLSAVPVNP